MELSDIITAEREIMKKVSLCFLVFLVLICFCSCEQGPKATVKQTDSLDKSIECLGTVNKIYESSTSRFVTGETLLNYYKGVDVVFIGKLVEYNDLTKSFADYVETITADKNALMHQHYNVSFDPDKKYVEFCAYVDKQTGVVQEYEIRVFDGDFVYREGEWYAKSCYFNNTFTKDLSNNLDVDFGFEMDIVTLDPESLPTSEYIYDYSTGKLVASPSTSENSSDGTAPEYNEVLADEVTTAVKKIGTVARVFDEGETVSFKVYGNRGYYTCVVEYSAVNDKYTKLFDNVFAKDGFNAMYRFNHRGFGGKNQIFNEGSTYIEVIGEVDSKTGKICNYDLRRIDPETYKAGWENRKWDWYATYIYVSSIE